METRSTTRFIDDTGETLVNLYGQWDGYAGGHGRDLALWLKRMTVVNGITDYKAKNTANGIHCLAAQAIAKFKAGIGCYYLMPVSYENENWSYEVRVTEANEIRLRVTYDGRQIFDGMPKNFRSVRIEKRAYRD